MGQQACYKPLGNASHNGRKPLIRINKKKKGLRRGTEAAAGRPLIARNRTGERTPSRRRSGGWTSSHREEHKRRERTPSRRRSGGWASSHRKKRDARKDSVAAPKWRLDVLPSRGAQETRKDPVAAPKRRLGVHPSQGTGHELGGTNLEWV
ncbi:hypothetical protein IW262DRAFT_1294517 [Armillaria fumosa]|nr:hypothetical protein IW262DRAFT_1294517 [Armillaria fumosa]